MSIKGQGHSLTLVKGQTDLKVKCLTFGLYTQVSDSGPLGPLVYVIDKALSGELSCPCDRSCLNLTELSKPIAVISFAEKL